MSGYYNYFHFGLSRYADRLLVRVRERVCRIFITEFSPTAKDKVLDIGVSDDNHVSANYLERIYPYPASIVALCRQPYRSLKATFPAITPVCGDGKALPFADESLDYVYSHAVIEHTGSRASQARFLAEAWRVCKKGIMVTTPNRRHPVETHIGLPFLHYLPAPVFRRLCSAFGKTMYAQEETLNLLTPRDLATLIGQSGIPADQIEYHNIRWLGIVCNLVLVIRKPAGRWQLAGGIEEPAREQTARLDRKRKKKASNKAQKESNGYQPAQRQDE